MPARRRTRRRMGWLARFYRPALTFNLTNQKLGYAFGSQKYGRPLRRCPHGSTVPQD